MKDIEQLKNILSKNVEKMGITPLYFYYGGSIANGTFINGQSDYDIIVVVDSLPFFYVDAAKAQIDGVDYSILFDEIDDYFLQKDMSKKNISKLYGYINFSFVKEEEISVSKWGDSGLLQQIIYFAKDNARAASLELLKRKTDFNNHQKENYHILHAMNFLYGEAISLENILKCKKGLITIEAALRKGGS